MNSLSRSSRHILLLLLSLTPAIWALCPRPSVGDQVMESTHLYSSHGVLEVTLDFFKYVNPAGATLYCFMTPYGDLSPVLHLNPGETLMITLKNQGETGQPLPTSSLKYQPTCEGMMMDDTMINIHFHGLEVDASCHADEVINTNIMPTRYFNYKVFIPKATPAGLYSYHAHIHGFAQAQLEGGASGMIVIDGFENYYPWAGNMRQRFLVLRDQALEADDSIPDPNMPSLDLSVNFVPIVYPNNVPAVMKIEAEQYELWRITSLCALSTLKLQLLYDNVPQDLLVVSIDGVPLATRQNPNRTYTYTSFDLPTLRRVELIVKAPDATVTDAVLKSLYFDVGPEDKMTERPLIKLELADSVPGQLRLPPAGNKFSPDQILDVSKLLSIKASATRTIFFSQEAETLTTPEAMFITVDGRTPKAYSNEDPPDFEVLQGTVEDWIIENRSPELHVFHIHQIHFLILEVNGVPVPQQDMTYEDIAITDYWSGNSNDPYPSIKVRMDFRTAPQGVILYHCHILEHEDLGMMAKFVIKGQSAKKDHVPLIVGLTVGLGGALIVIAVLYKHYARKASSKLNGAGNQQAKAKDGYEKPNEASEKAKTDANTGRTEEANNKI